MQSSVEQPKTHDEACMLRLAGVSKSYGGLEAVKALSFSVRRGELFGLVGSDGAGKTTLLRMIAGLLRPDAGSIQIDGRDALRQREVLKHLIGYMPQRFGLYPDLSVDENLDFFMDIFGIQGALREQRRRQYLGFSNLLPFRSRQARDLSGGMKQKLGLACVLVHEPALLILDEPTNGVDPVSRREFWEILLEMKSRGKTLLVSTSYLDEGEKCDRLLLMHKAQALQLATPGEIRGLQGSLEEALVQKILQSDADAQKASFAI